MMKTMKVHGLFVFHFISAHGSLLVPDLEYAAYYTRDDHYLMVINTIATKYRLHTEGEATEPEVCNILVL